jgi:GNAT superfamily N-acetyltransferase
MKPLKIESITKVEDAGRVARVHHTSRRQAYLGMLPDEYLNKISFPQREEQWAEDIEKSQEGNGRIWLAHQDPFDVGIVALGPAKDDDLDKKSVGELYVIYVMPDFWGSGAGKYLFDHAVEQAKQAKFKELVAWVYEPNDRARRFYERQGMKLTKARRPIYDGASVFVVRYSMPLV